MARPSRVNRPTAPEAHRSGWDKSMNSSEFYPKRLAGRAPPGVPRDRFCATTRRNVAVLYGGIWMAAAGCRRVTLDLGFSARAFERRDRAVGPALSSEQAASHEGGFSMPSEMSAGSFARRLVAFYGIVVVIGIAVVVLVVNKGHNEKALASIAGGYSASAPNSCLGPAPAKPGGIALPSTAPAQAANAGPVVQRAPVGRVRQPDEQPADAGRPATAGLREAPGRPYTGSPARCTASAARPRS